MRSRALPAGATIPVLGQGTWQMGENAKTRSQEIDALKFGVDSGRALSIRQK